jgi:hypothetical protein
MYFIKISHIILAFDYIECFAVKREKTIPKNQIYVYILKIFQKL